MSREVSLLGVARQMIPDANPAAVSNVREFLADVLTTTCRHAFSRHRLVRDS
jgi:hypothetical protein